VENPEEKTTMERFLAPHEAAVMAGGVRVVLCSEVTGELDEGTLTDALAQLVICYPLLASRCPTKDGRPLVQVDTQLAEPVLSHGSHFGDEINTPLTWAQGPLFRITLLREPDRTRVVMTLPRAFADGMSYLALHRRFWAIYTALRENTPVPLDVVEPVLGPALDDLMDARFSPQQLRDFVAERARLDVTEPPAVLPPLAAVNGGPGGDLTFGIAHAGAAADRAAALSRLAHESSLTVNALVSGALLTSLRSFLEPATGPARMLCTSAVDMRRRLVPPMPAEVLQSAATTTSLRLDVDASATPVEVGLDVSRRLRADLDSGAAAMELAAFPYMIDQHPPTLVITNVGVIDEPVLPEGLAITSVRLAPFGHLPMIFAVVSRYLESLSIDLLYSKAWFTEDQIQNLALRTSATLAQLTAPQQAVR
jgi:hypothetical protein